MFVFRTFWVIVSVAWMLIAFLGVLSGMQHVPAAMPTWLILLNSIAMIFGPPLLLYGAGSGVHRLWVGRHFSIIALLLLGACAYSPTELQPLPAASNAETATVTVQRDDQIFGAAMTWTVLVDDRPVANLTPGDDVRLTIPVGLRTIGLACGKGVWWGSDDLVLPLDEDAEYRLRAFAQLASPCRLQLTNQGPAPL